MLQLSQTLPNFFCSDISKFHENRINLTGIFSTESEIVFFFYAVQCMMDQSEWILFPWVEGVHMYNVNITCQGTTKLSNSDISKMYKQICKNFHAVAKKKNQNMTSLGRTSTCHFFWDYNQYRYA